MGKRKPEKPRSMVPEYGDVRDPKVRARYGYLEANVSIAGNSMLFGVKLVLGLFINSISLIADAFHTLSDVGTSGVVIFGFKMSAKPPDERHPHGHGRVEYISTLVIAVLLVFTGILFAYESVKRLYEPSALLEGDAALVIGIAIIVSAVGKELMARFSIAIGRKIRSDVLVGDAWHHRSDALASVAVGLGLVGSSYGYPILDPVFGVIVSAIIIYVGADLFRKSSDFLIGRAPDTETVEMVRGIARGVKGVKGVHDIEVHDYGATCVISLHAEVADDLSFEEAHGLADRLEVLIRKRIQCSTIIHTDPVRSGGGGRMDHRLIEGILDGERDIISFDNIRMIRRGGSGDQINVNIIVDKDMPVSETHTLSHRIERAISRELGPVEVAMHFEPCKDDCPRCALSCRKRKRTREKKGEKGEKGENREKGTKREKGKPGRTGGG